MKTIKFLGLAAVAGSMLVSCGQETKLDLNDRLDSVNYAFGCMNGGDIYKQIIGADTTSTERINDFIEGFEVAYAKVEGVERIKVDAAFFTNMFVRDTKSGFLFSDKTIPFRDEIFMESVEKSIRKQATEMTVEQSMEYVQRKMYVPIDSGEVRTDAEIDSINMAYAIFNGKGIRDYILMGDTTDADITAFLDFFKSTKAKGEDARLYTEGLRIGRAIYGQVEQVKFFMGDTTLIMDADLIKEAVLRSVKKEGESMTRLEAQELLNTINGEIEAKKAEVQGKAGVEFLEQNKTKEGVQVTASGLQYVVNKMGTGEKPTADNTVKVHYEGRLIDGKVFDSSIERGEPISFPLKGVIKGWTEGLQLMPVGSKFTFYIPQELGYGSQGAGADIPGYATLIFDVELLGIEK